MIRLADSSESKIPIILNWRQDERGDTHVVVTFVDVETYLGTDGEIFISPQNWSDLSGSIPWEVLCSFRNRLPRVVT